MVRVVAFDGEFSGRHAYVDSYYVVAWGLCVVDSAKPSEVVASLRVCMEAPTARHRFARDCWDEFWQQDCMQAKLAEFRAEAVEPEAGMAAVLAFLREHVGDGTGCAVVCDFSFDALWMNYYLGAFTDAPALHTFTGAYRSWPLITDDVYRGDLGVLDDWALDARIDEKYGFTGIPKGTHDSEVDAREIAVRFARYLHAKGQ